MSHTRTKQRMEQLRAAIRERYGFTEFKPHQEEVLTYVLDGQDVLGTISTGGGKSLCYQGPTLIDESGITVVISPLIALMHDQVDGLLARGIEAAYIDSTLTRSARSGVAFRLHRKMLKLLYVSPETLNSEAIYKEIGDNKVNRLVVDEAHCVSMWGHDFRPEYLKIPKFRERLGNPQLLAFTATAPVLVRDEIIEYLHMESAMQIVGEVDRPNIHLENLIFASDEARWAYLLPRIREHAKKDEATIVYCRRIRTVRDLAERLRGLTRGVSARVYHGELEGEERRETEGLFLKGTVPILLATKAFGMGVDHPRIRHIYHYEVPESLEAYYQEIGRAGRDGAPAEAVLLYDRHDIMKLKSFIQTSNPGLGFLRRVYYFLQRSGLAKELAAAGPQRTVVIKRFVEEFGDGNRHIEQMIGSALGQLQKYGVIEQWSNQVRFLVTPADIERDGFPVDEATINAKRDRDMLRLKVMLHYATRPTSEARTLILDHFRTNAVVEHVKDMPLTAFYPLPDPLVLTVCGALADSDQPKSSFPGYLMGKNRVKGPYAGKLPLTGVGELKLDIEQVGSLGYMRHVPLGDATWYTITELGLKFIVDHGGTEPPLATVEDLKKRIFSPRARTLLREALGDWWSRESRGRSSADQWWRLVEDFMVARFTVLDTDVSGDQLIRYYQRIGSRARMFKRYGRELLNHLFDNAVVT